MKNSYWTEASSDGWFYVVSGPDTKQWTAVAKTRSRDDADFLADILNDYAEPPSWIADLHAEAV